MSSDADTVQKEKLPLFRVASELFENGTKIVISLLENGTKWPIIPLENGTNVLVLFRRYRDYVVSQSFKGNREMD